MDRIFQKSSVEQICEEIKAILNQCKNHMEQMTAISRQAKEALAQVPADVRDENVSSAAAMLRSRIDACDLDSVIRKLDNCKEKACVLIPAADSQYAAETRQLTNTTNQIREVIRSLNEFMINTPMTMDYSSFKVLFEASQAKWDKVLTDAEGVLDTLLKNAKGAEQISAVFSKDPVNLSTGNFICDRTDLEIPGAEPFLFGRFYNAINERSGVLGNDWNHNYEVLLEGKHCQKTLVLEEGKEETFLLTATGHYAPLHHSNGTLGETEEGYTYLTQDQRTYTFNKEGRYETQTDLNGNKTKLHYKETEGTSRLQKIERSTGEYFTLSYDEEGKLTRVTDHSGRSIRYEFQKGRLHMVTTPKGSEYLYSYTPQGKLESVMNPRGIVTVENIFDEQNRTVKQHFPDGGSMSYEYNDQKREVVLCQEKVQIKSN